jgi:hypothetical protein
MALVPPERITRLDDPETRQRIEESHNPEAPGSPSTVPDIYGWILGGECPYA